MRCDLYRRIYVRIYMNFYFRPKTICLKDLLQMLPLAALYFSHQEINTTHWLAFLTDSWVTAADVFNSMHVFISLSKFDLLFSGELKGMPKWCIFEDVVSCLFARTIDIDKLFPTPSMRNFAFFACVCCSCVVVLWPPVIIGNCSLGSVI